MKVHCSKRLLVILVHVCLMGSWLPQAQAANLPAWTQADGDNITQWLFQPGETVDHAPDPQLWATVQVPFLWAGQGAKGDDQQLTGLPLPWAKQAEKAKLEDCNNGWFEREASIPSAWQGKRIWLKFDQIECDGLLWVGDHEPIFLPGPEARVDLTDLVAPGETTILRLWVTRWWEGVPLKPEDDPLRSIALERNVRSWKGDHEAQRRAVPAGISGRVHFEVRPLQAEITDVFAQTSVREKTLTVDVTVLGRKNVSGGSLRISIVDPAGEGGEVPAVETVPLRPDALGRQIVQIPWADPHLWELGDGYLYQLKVELLDKDGQVVYAAPAVSFGFREVWTEGREIILNGHPVHLRFAPVLRPDWPSFLFYESMGFNTFELQPNVTSWFVTRGRRPLVLAEEADCPYWMNFGITEETLAKMDERGLALFMPAVGLSNIRQALMTPEAKLAYRRETRLWLEKLRNHPSILVWEPSMNTGSVSREDPSRIGQNPQDYINVPDWYAGAKAQITHKDPTRLVINHCGIDGDMDFPNQYLNFMPLQERISFPSRWASDGYKPWGIAEHGTPYTRSFCKWYDVPLFTEYFAAYLGDDAYAQETDEYVRLVDKATQRNKSFFGAQPMSPGEFVEVSENTAFFEYDRLFTEQTNRNWRAWGVPGGWWPWMFYTGFGVPPQQENKAPGWGYFYETLTQEQAESALEAAPDWANPTYDVYRETMQPLLAYIGGKPEQFTEQGHAYYDGETIVKSAVLVWDGNETASFDVGWAWSNGDETLASDMQTVTLKPGDVQKLPIVLTAPSVTGREDTVLSLTVRQKGKDTVLQDDTFALSLWPQLSEHWKNQSVWAVYDPAGKSRPWLESLGVNAVAVTSPEELQESQADVLVVGREALRHGKLPLTDEDIANGLRVLMLEQMPQDWKSLGFRMQDIVTRYAFPRDTNSPMLEGLEDEDFINWRGNPDLLPQTSEGMEPWPNKRPPHWGNEGAVASVVLETPQSGAFTPLVNAEFDLAYSPLMEWRHGKGGMLLSTFDFTERVGIDPPATQLASNILKALDKPYPSAQARQLVYCGDDADWDYVGKLGFASRRGKTDDMSTFDVDDTLLVLGGGALDANGPDIAAWVERGGDVFVLPQSAKHFAEAGLPFVLKTHDISVSKLVPEEDVPLLRGIGPQELHWRTFAKQQAFEAGSLPATATSLLDGLLVEIPAGKGRWVFSQLDWKPFDDGSWNLEKTRWNTMKVYRQLLTNLGAMSDPVLAETLLEPRYSAPMTNVNAWQALNSVYQVGATEPGILKGLGKTLPVESVSGQRLKDEAATADKSPAATAAPEIMIGKGEENVMRADNKGKWMLLEPRPDGRVHLDWVSAPAMGKIGYARTYIYSSRDREAVFAMGADYWMVFRINGEAVIDNTQKSRPAHAPFSCEYQFSAPLKKGWNLLEVKVGSGNGGFGFWCSVSDPGDLVVAASLHEPDNQPATPSDGLLPEPDFQRETIFYERALTADDDPYSLVPW